MIESKSCQVSASGEQSMIDAMQCFGWELKSSQEVNVKESHLENRGGSLMSVTTGERYIKLVFSRDTNHRNYARLKQLEEIYFGILSQRPAPMNIKIALLGLIVMIFPGILYIIHKKKQQSEWENALATKGMAAMREARSLI